jgi:hypothetical protein
MLSSGTEPLLSRDQPSTPEELKRAESLPPGAQSYRLVSVKGFDPEKHVGERVEVKGLIYRDETDARINVTSLQMVGRCGL